MSLKVTCEQCGEFGVPIPWPRTDGVLDPCWPCEHLGKVLEEFSLAAFDKAVETISAAIDDFRTKVKEQG